MIFFNTIVKRVSNFSIESYDTNKNNLADFFKTDELFNLCLLSASSSLYNALHENKSERTQSSLSNYFMRAHFNPTPFGAFNSVGIMHWDVETNIPKSNKLRLLIKYDNLFISSKVDQNIPSDWKKLTYCTNPSIYFLNDERISFYKSENKIFDKIEISYTELDVDQDLKWLLEQFKGPRKIEGLIDELVLQGFNNFEVEAFLLEIIETGLIIETFLFNPYADKLNKPYLPYLSDLVVQKEHVLETKDDITAFIARYKGEQNALFEKKDWPKNFYAINSFDTEQGALDIAIQKKIKKYIDFNIQYNSENQIVNDNLNKFIGKISEKYNDGFIPLNEIFNPYSGINYRSLKLEGELSLNKEILARILASPAQEVFLDLPALENLEIKQSKLPATFNVILETLICKKTGESVVYILGMGDPSSLNIISRFSDVAKAACTDIVEYEKEVNKDKIIADINCVGNFRSINVAPVEQRYDYCIPINTSHQESSNPILLSDLFLHLHGKNISLVSKLHRKEVLPKKVSVINQMLFESDLYNFLCDYELYNSEIYGVNFNFNVYRHCVPYVPRIYLEKGILLQPAQIFLVFNNFTLQEFKDYLAEKIEYYSFSKKIIFIDKQRQLVIDSETQNNIELLFEKLKANNFFYVSECLYENFTPKIVRKNENFAHELIASVKNPYYFRQNYNYENLEISKDKSQNIALVSDWLYVELYCNMFADSEIFALIQNQIILKNKACQFFFVNYSNPDRHLRLRFKTDSVENKKYILTLIHDLKSRNIISRYIVLPYEQELYRYGGQEVMGFSEKIFNLDSRNYLEYISPEDLDQNKIDLIAILKIKNYLTFFGFSLEDMILNCENVLKNFSNEFKLTSQLRKDFNKDYSLIKFEIENFRYENFLENKPLQIEFAEMRKNLPEFISYVWLVIHMSLNRHFKTNQRFNEFKSYYMAKSYLNQIKYKNNIDS